MSNFIDIQEPGDIVYTMREGKLLAWKVQEDGTLVQVDTTDALMGRIE